MSGTLMHASAASKVAFGAKAGVLLVLAAGAGLFAWGVPGVREVAREVPPAQPVKLVEPTKADGPAVIEAAMFEEIAFGLQQIANVPQALAAAPVDPDEEPLPDDPPLPEATDEVAFIGAVITAERRVAVLRVNEKQVWIGEGETKQDIEVLTVDRGEVRLRRHGGQEFTLEPAPRKEGQITQLARSVPTRTPAVAGGRPNFPGRQGAGVEGAGEAAAAISAEIGGGAQFPRPEGENMDPERAERFRRAQERMRERQERDGGQR